MEIHKLANAFYQTADLSDGIGSAAKRSEERYKRKHGGVWVGGKVIISNEKLIFMVNGLNRSLHRSVEDVEILIHHIISVSYEFGWITGIVVVSCPDEEFRFRCYGAKEVANDLNKIIT